MKLEIGYNHSFEVRRETCPADCEDNFSILYLSDLHLNKFSQGMTASISATINELNPTVVLLGGDYADSQKGLIYFNDLLRSISHRDNVFAIAGNHDYSFGIDQIKKTVTENHIVWLENKSFLVNLKNTKLKIDGNFISKENCECDFSILALHKPVHINKIKDYYHIACAGHLHGGQFVLWQTEQSLFPGRLFYKWNILKTKVNNCLYVISKGLGDTLPVRYNCKRDLLFIQVTTNNKK